MTPTGAPDDQLARSLRRFSLFEHVDDDALLQLVQLGTSIAMGPGELLLQAGEHNRHAYVVLDGHLRVHLGSEASEPVAVLEPGEVVGELSVIDRRPASAFVVADGTCTVLRLGEEGFWQLVEMSHHFAVKLMHKLAERLRANNNAFVESTQLRERYERAALYDALTGLHNRRWLDETLPRLVDRHRHGGRPLSVGVVDVDHFKRFNDTHGHDAGDEVLKTVARALVDKLRPTDLVARMGGEEFVLLLPETPLQGARAAAERLREAVEGATVVSPAGLSIPAVTVSIGLAMMEPEQGATALLKAADEALYAAKRNGRNRIECAHTEVALTAIL